VCVGRNYGAHAKELGNSVPTKPVLFFKPSTCLLTEQQKKSILIPNDCELHHEVELGVIIGKKATNIKESEALDYISGYVVALDMTARNWQEVAKKGGLPWTLPKGEDNLINATE
jgi:acylpyruvate hydrolase